MKAKIAWIVTEIGYGNPILVFSEPGCWLLCGSG